MIGGTGNVATLAKDKGLDDDTVKAAIEQKIALKLTETVQLPNPENGSEMTLEKGTTIFVRVLPNMMGGDIKFNTYSSDEVLDKIDFDLDVNTPIDWTPAENHVKKVAGLEIQNTAPSDGLVNPEHYETEKSFLSSSANWQDICVEFGPWFLKVFGLAFLFIYTLVALIIDAERAVPLVIIVFFTITFVLCSTYFTHVPEHEKAVWECLAVPFDSLMSVQYLPQAIGALILLGFTIWLIIELSDDPIRFISLLGMAVLILMCWLGSWRRADVNWRPVLWGLALQWILALFILRTDPGYDAFDWLGDQASKFLTYSNVGAGFIFDEANMFQHYFAFVVLPTVIYFSSIVSMLYHLGALQYIIGKIAWLMKKTMQTSTAESINAAGNIFVGQTEAPLLIAPFLKTMSLSEVHAVMTGGFATIAGGVLAAYIGMGVPAQHLIAASVMSAPAALAISKLIFPEDPKRETDDSEAVLKTRPQTTNIIDAAANGAAVAIPLVANIAAMLIAFLSILAFFDAVLSWFGNFVGYDELSFEKICGWLFWPMAFLMGVPMDDCEKVGSLLGLKTFANEFVAYQSLQTHINEATLDDRSIVISTYALCGFANFGSMGIALGGLTPLAPEREKEFARVVFSAMIAGTIACFMTACIAGVLYKE